MPTIANYDHFAGKHWETGSVHNFFAQRGFTAPHSGEPYSEAFLMGVSGGAVMGYFTFLYEGYDPQCNVLTRNTFDPLDKMLSRLGVVQYVEHTAKPQRAEDILIDTLAEGQPAIVWADMWSLPYNALPWDKGMWGAFPLVVYGYEPQEDTVYIADRANVPLTVTIGEFAAARGRIKKIKHRLLTLGAPVEEKLAAAARLGICDTIQLFTEKPPKGSKNNFGLNAYQFWAKMLTRPKQRLSWEKQFPAGLPMYAGLTSAYEFSCLFGKGTAQDAERGLYAAFLDEAAVLLQRPALSEAAARFRAAAGAWQQLPGFLLPQTVALFAESRELLLRRHSLFLEQGGAARTETESINARLKAIHDAMDKDFPLTQEEVEAFRERLAAQIMAIHDVEASAVQILQEAIA
jgi:Butirosin biosynthesis protein H, N-terminal/Domain of unknown function (DUF4872)